MPKLISIGVLLSLLFFMPACKSQPTTPPTPPPTTHSITVHSSSDMLYIGTSETFTATATMSDGSTKTVIGGVWGGDNPSVATVETIGRVTIVGSGMVSIFVDYQGKRGSKVIRGLPNYQGSWSGSYYIASCNATGYFADTKFCNTFLVNMVLPTDLILTQEKDRVDGRFYLGTLSADTTGPVHTDGQLLLTGVIREGILTIEVSWRLQSMTPGRITGALRLLFRATGWSGDGRLSCIIRDLNRTSTMTIAPAPGGLRLMNPTLEDLLHALVGR